MAGDSCTVKVKIDHVKKVFNVRGNEVVALNGVDLEIKENEFVCVVGPSGCGKSTLLNIIAGLDVPSSGNVLLDGNPIDGPGTERGVVFQQYALFPWLTVEKNIAFGLKSGCLWQNRTSLFRDIQTVFFGNATLLQSRQKNLLICKILILVLIFREKSYEFEFLFV